MKTVCIIGIDPGQNGAIAYIDLFGTLLDVIKMPKDYLAIKNSINNPKYSVGMVFTEDVNAHACGRSVKNVWTFARHVRDIEIACWHNLIPEKKINVKQWKDYYGLKRNKIESCEKAITVFNYSLYSNPFMKLKNNGSYTYYDGKAEAALIGLYGLRKYYNEEDLPF